MRVEGARRCIRRAHLERHRRHTARLYERNEFRHEARADFMAAALRHNRDIRDLSLLKGDPAAGVADDLLPIEREQVARVLVGGFLPERLARPRDGKARLLHDRDSVGILRLHLAESQIHFAPSGWRFSQRTSASLRRR